jgi:adenine-specific DNA-methyltransferase
MIQLNNDYQREDFLKFIEKDFLTDFKRDIRPVNTSGLSSIQKAHYLGASKTLDLQVFEFLFEGSPSKRVALTKDAFSVMRSSAIFRALAIFHSPDNKDWRLSLMTATPEPTQKGKVSLLYSNPKRLSFFLGSNSKINTPTKFLISRGTISDFEDLKNRFSMEVVNKEFYKEISKAFTSLVGGLLKLPSTQDKSQINLEFAVRLIGRIIFCWFLREKKSQAGLSLMPKELLSVSAVKNTKDYYHRILEPVFFEVLNRPVQSRREDFVKEPFSFVPYLNGGLFSPQEDDFYKRVSGDFQSQLHNALIAPDSWFRDFFEILETYNFTIDENTSYDEELSIDPEMLGRIFENLLAEINPETGESARKSTGSYYTPRIIVDYMVDESLLLYLKEQTKINEEKLKAIISYDLIDDLENPVTAEEKEKIIDALEKVKILDPACGSGAFPIGALQKIVFILQQADSDGQLWFKKQIENTSPEIKRLFEREFNNKNFDYIRKLGIIRENIYGVDIQPIASEVSRLRCFLTLIVDQKIQDNMANRGIEPLPNLDFKFVTANSLIGLPKSEKLRDNSEQMGMFDDNKKIEELKLIRNEYFTSSGIEREQLKSQFSSKQKDLIFQLIQEHGFISIFKAELTQKLTEWDPFSHKASSWFDPEWMFGIQKGFDIIITNPPYYRSRDISKELVDKYISRFEYVQSGFDLASLFVEFADKIINKNGIITFILTNKVFSARYGIKLRRYLIDNSRVQQIINLFPHLFENTPVETSIMILSHNNEHIYYSNYYKKSSERLEKFLLYNRIDPKIFLKLPNNIFVFPTKKIEFSILEKMKDYKERISSFFSISAGYGITGIRQQIDNEKSELNNIPVYSGKSIWKYYNLKPEYYTSEKNKLLTFSNKDVLIRELSTINRATIIADDGVEGVALNSITLVKSKNNLSDTKWFLALFNSKLFYLLYCLFYESTRTHSNLRFKAIYLNDIPIPHISDIDKESLNSLIDKILLLTKSDIYHKDLSLQSKVKVYEREIDKLVYRLYDLTLEEIAIVENFTK